MNFYLDNSVVLRGIYTSLESRHTQRRFVKIINIDHRFERWPERTKTYTIDEITKNAIHYLASHRNILL